MDVFEIDRTRYDYADKETFSYKAPEGLTEELVREISRQKKEPQWMLQKRLEAYRKFLAMPMPHFGPDLSGLNLDDIYYYVRPDAKKNAKSWEEVPESIRKTYDRLGIPEAEKSALGGVGAQYDSDMIYHNIKKEWEDKGVLFLDMDVALQEHPDLVKDHFMTECVPPSLHKFVALHTAVWSSGSFVYVPKGVKLDKPLQAYFRMNARKGGQFEHTLIILDEGAECHYIEGCSAPQYNASSIHAGCVEVIVKKGARARYTSIENWSKNTYNLNTKVASVHEDSVMEWVGGNLGSGTTMLYPCSILRGDRSSSDSISIAFANKGQNQDVGSKAIHLGKETSSTITSKSISRDGGIATYRGLLSIAPGAKNARSSVTCDALMMDDRSQSNTYPIMNVRERSADVAHEATVGKISEDQIFYLMSRGLDEKTALQMIVSGFIEPVVKELPLEYAMELNKLIELELEGSLG
ncbi:MAG: Fe-S cluster assembly protein SufB [Candidatus Woesearchaeota archaeon]